MSELVRSSRWRHPVLFVLSAALLACAGEADNEAETAERGEELTCGGGRQLCAVNFFGAGGFGPNVACTASDGSKLRPLTLEAAFPTGPVDPVSVGYPDVDGDGNADICARRGIGIACRRRADASTSTAAWESSFTDANGWGAAPYGSTIRYADLDGDGKGDVCGRGSGGIWCGRSDGYTFAPISLWTTSYSDAQGWGTSGAYYSTIQFADLNNDGKLDVCGRGTDGIWCALSTGTSFGAPTRWTAKFNDIDGWNAAPYFSTLRLVDVNGDHKADICGRGSGGIDCALSTGTSFGTVTTWATSFSDANGWHTSAAYYGTLRYADIDGDGRLDVCGRGTSGVYCGLGTVAGTSFGAVSLWVASFANPWWSSPDVAETLQLVDLNNDNKADICGRYSQSAGGAGGASSSDLYCGVSSGTAFTYPTVWSTGVQLSNANWARPTYGFSKVTTNTCAP